MNPWMTKRGRKAIERMGWPTIEVGWYLGWDVYKHCFNQGIGLVTGSIHERVALCLLREHAREWLEKRHVHIWAYYPVGTNKHRYMAGRTGFSKDATGNPYGMQMTGGVPGTDYCGYTNYDRLLIAAVLAAGE